MCLNRRDGALRLIMVWAVSASLLLLAACSSEDPKGQTAVVVPERLEVRSTTATVARTVTELRRGDRVRVLERAEDGGANWVKLRAPGGQTGWVEAHNLVGEEVVERSRQLAEEMKPVQTQAVGRSKATLRLRLTPERAADNVATLLPSRTVLEIVDRARRPRPAPTDAKSATQPVADVKEGEDSPAGTRYDQWYKVRVKDNPLLPAGWIYAGSVELDVPPEISYYVSSGRRIIGWQKIGTARDEDGRAGDHYLVFERWAASADEQADFHRLQVLAYDPASRDYYVPFREDTRGRFPVTLKMEGSRGKFQLQALDREDQAYAVDYTVELLESGRVRITRVTPKTAARDKRKR
jgi:uncharacterized protein YgiM (DUF1202 family)